MGTEDQRAAALFRNVADSASGTYTATMRTIKAYQLLNHFNTRGTIPTGFLDVGNGVGASPAEAIQCALERLADHGWDTGGLMEQILTENKSVRDPSSANTPSYFVSVYVR